MNQISFFDGNKKFVFDKPIRLIELFAGVGSQAMALRDLGIPLEHWRVCEFDKYAITSYNAIHGTDFEPSDICQLHAEDLGIADTDKYLYIMTYSFPCQDLSKAGKGKGMARGGNTRSGLLWEVERLLDECGELPQLLLMENVPDVVGTSNVKHFAEWVQKLESMGYYNKWEILNAKDYGIPQNRERCFMVSLQGDYYYDFPKPVPLELRLKDMLEDDVPESYYISDAQVEKIINSTFSVTANSIYDGGGIRDIMCQRLQGSEVCKTVRTSGRGSLDRHSWDMVIENGEVDI